MYAYIYIYIYVLRKFTLLFYYSFRPADLEILRCSCSEHTHKLPPMDDGGGLSLYTHTHIYIYIHIYVYIYIHV